MMMRQSFVCTEVHSAKKSSGFYEKLFGFFVDFEYITIVGAPVVVFLLLRL
jgi:hypothetical protein